MIRSLPFRAALKDGTCVTVREMGPLDRALLQQGFASLSPESRFMRFLGAHAELTEEELDRYTSAPDETHYSIGAIDGATPLASAHIFHLEDGQTAELAVTVVDAAQGRGLGGLLLSCLLHEAQARGITGLTALVHRDNASMRQLLDRFGARRVVNHEAEQEYLLDVPPMPLAKSA